MILLISLCKEKLSEEEFVKPLQKIIEGGSENKADDCTVSHYQAVTSEQIAKASHIILSGTAIQDNEYQEHDWAWLKEFKKPLLGICSGMQVLGMVHGGRITKHEVMDVTTITVKQSPLLAEGEYQVYELHDYSITLPEGFELLAGTPDNALMIRKGEQYGVLFHPEVRMEKIIKNFLAL